jgi:glycosyltransferase involved in cell wall biosynthesis
MVRRRRNHITFSWVWDWANYGLLAAKLLWGHPYAVCLDTYMHNAPWDKQDLVSRLRRELRYGLAFRHADIIMAETPAIFENSKRYVPAADVLLVPNCIWRRDVEKVELDWAAEGFQPVRESLILFAGQIIPRKGVHDLLAAFAPLAPRFPGWKIAILGPSPDPNYIVQLRRIIEETGLKDRVVIAPSLTGDALYRRFRTCSIYCMPTYHEGIPTTILEAMYFGGAIISGSAGFVDYQLDNGDCGMLFTPGDVDALRSCLEQLMAAESLRRHYMQRARQRMVNMFVWELYFDTIKTACARRIARPGLGSV